MVQTASLLLLCVLFFSSREFAMQPGALEIGNGPSRVQPFFFSLVALGPCRDRPCGRPRIDRVEFCLCHCGRQRAEKKASGQH